MAQNTLGLLVSGGPAPGINGVIEAATIEAVNRGLAVVGVLDGFRHLATDHFDPARHARRLSIADVARRHFEGGSILRTSRTTLLDKEQLAESNVVIADDVAVQNALDNLRRLGVTHLVTIGGDDTALSARFLAEASGGQVRIIHVPKTIDNDLPLAGDYPTFGFNTARHYGTQLVAHLMEDARTTQRWYLAIAMGRQAGFLALGIGLASGATLTVIPEEFPERTTVSDIVDVLECAVLKRRTMGRQDGVAVIAEGVAYKLGDREELSRLMGREVPLDAAGHMRLSDLPIGPILKDALAARFGGGREKLTVVDQTVGYELRCAPPTPFDIAYCRTLGHGSVRLLLDTALDRPYQGAMVSLLGGNITPMSFEEMIDPRTNRVRTRCVDLQSDFYRVARAYMIRLDRNDLEDAGRRQRLADEAGMSPDGFRARYGRVAGLETEAPNRAMQSAVSADSAFSR